MVSYSREAEVEADKLSVRYVKKAGFNPESVINVLEMLQALRKEGPIRRYMHYRTHPYLSERLAKAKIEVRGKMDFDSFINLPEEEENF
jgi:predicted Zn-dependent protease